MAERKKILIADDDTHVHDLLNHVLPGDEFEVIHAYDGRETLECVKSGPPDLIVLDIMMPVRDGRDICRDLKNDPRTRDILILMLTGRDEQHERIAGLELGADDYMVKPFSPNHVARKIRKLFAKRDNGV